jgi:GxxExxY protein
MEQKSFAAHELNQLTEKIIGAAIEVHRQLGPGLLESTYEACLVYELQRLNLQVERQLQLPIVYKEIQLEQAYRIDLLVEQKVIIELKAVEQLLPIHEAQLLSYLKHAGKRAGLLFNFNVKLLKDGGIRRFVRD